jgi:hypothetical protein
MPSGTLDNAPKFGLSFLRKCRNRLALAVGRLAEHVPVRVHVAYGMVQGIGCSIMDCLVVYAGRSWRSHSNIDGKKQIR